jgi:hypothetical protein
MYVCDNCGRRYPATCTFKHVFPDIPDLFQRLDVGGTVPAGECPACGALVYPEAEPVRVLIVLDGGLVQEILTDRPGVEAAVLDQDQDGVDERELVTVADGGIDLSGTLQAHGIVLQPGIVTAAWRCT